jgi:cobalt-zinc-cadmium efflux system outer membrane protein
MQRFFVGSVWLLLAWCVLAVRPGEGQGPNRPARQSTEPLLPIPASIDSAGSDVRDNGSLIEPTSVETLVAEALAGNPRIQAARSQAQSLAARVPQVESLPDPTLMTTIFLEEIQTAAGPQEAALSLSQRFPWFGKRALKGQLAYYDSLAAYARVTIVELEVVEQVKRAYYDLYFLQSAERETKRLRQPLEDVIVIAQTRFETGARQTGLQDVLQAQIELSKLQTELVKISEDSRTAQAKLAGLLHHPPQAAFLTSDSLDRTHVENRVAVLVALAERCQPAYDVYRREIARDQAAVELARREQWPDITTSFNWYEMGGTGISPVANGRDAFSMGIGVNLPIRRRRLDAAVCEARNKLCATTRRFAAARDRFQVEIETLHADFREHQRTLQILEAEIVPRAEESLNLALESYRADRTSFQQLLDVYRTLLRYQIDLHRHLALREQAVASLERSVGCAVASIPEESIE